MSKPQNEIDKEYLELQKRYKNIQNDRKAYNEETQAQLKKHKNIIEKLQNENFRVKSSTTTTQRNFFKASEEIKQLKGKIEEQKASREKVEQDIIVLQKNRVIKQKNISNVAEEKQAQFQKQIRILENRLEMANQKFNEAIAKNKKLRENIDSLRRERVIFDNIYRKLEKELHSKREKMANTDPNLYFGYE